MASPGAAQQPAASPHAAATAKQVPRRTSLDALLKEGSLTAAAVGQSGLGLGHGSQDLTGLLLDPSLLQHMQSLPRGCRGGASLGALNQGHAVRWCPGSVPAAHQSQPAAKPSPACLACSGGQPLTSPIRLHCPTGMGTGIELDLLASPKWKALLSWEGDAGGTGGSGPSMDTAGSGDSAAPSNTAFHLAGLDGEGAPVSPGVDQRMSAAALEAAWREARQAQQAEQAGTAAPPVLVPQDVPEQEPQPAVRRRGFGGKKRPGPEQETTDSEAEAAAEAAGEGEDQAEAPPPTKQRRTEAHPGLGPVPASTLPAIARGHSLTTFSSGDTLMLEAEAAAAFDAEMCPKEDLSPTDVLTGLNRVRLNSIGSPRTHRRLTAAAAAAAVTPAGRLGQLRRGESNVPMLDAAVPGSPSGAHLLPAAGEGQGTVGAGAASLPAVHPKPAPLDMPAGPSAGASTADLAAAAAAAAAVVAACAPAAMPAVGAAVLPAPTAAPGVSQGERRLTSTGRQQLPTKSHKAVATGAGAEAARAGANGQRGKNLLARPVEQPSRLQTLGETAPAEPPCCPAIPRMQARAVCSQARIAV